MKISELLQTSEANLTEAGRMETKGNWRIGNLNGVIKTFKSADSPEAKAWMKNRDSAPPDRETVRAQRQQEKIWKDQEREQKRAERERNRKPTNDELRALYDEVVEAAGSSFPDGDPIDHFGDTLRKNNWTMDTVDLAFKKFGSGREKKGYDQFMIDMWDDFAADQTHDANMDLKAGRKPERSQFYDIKDGKAVIAQNPWKPYR